MLKAKLKVWIILFVIYILVYAFGGYVTGFITDLFKPEQEYKIAFNQVGNKVNINNTKIKTDYGKVKLVYNNQNPDIIITKSNEMKDGYEKLDNFLYTPFVLLTKNNWIDNDSGINHLSENHTQKYSKDIRYILEAIEQNKTWEDIGMSNKDVFEKIDAPVTLKIPNRYSEDYEEVKSYIMMVLNDYKPYETKDDLEKRADLILSKCEEVESIPALVNNLYNNSKNTDFGMVLCKESLIVECDHKDYNLAVINISQPVKVSYNLYIKKDNEDKINIVKQLVQKKQFFSASGLRNIESNDGIKDSDLNKVLQVLDCTELINYSNGKD